MVRLLARALPLVVVNEYPRSGGTWLGQMISEISGFDFPRNRTPKLTRSVMHGHYLYPFGINNIVIVWRDGRDAMVSLYYYSYFKNECDNGAMVDLMKRELPFKDYRAVSDNLPTFIDRVLSRPLRPRFTWQSFVRSWLGRDTVHIHYEQLLRNTVEEIRRVTAELSLFDADGSTVAKAVDEYSFDRVTAGRSGSGPEGCFVRKGIAGDWKNYFNRAARETFARCAGDELIALGYERDFDWVVKETVADERSSEAVWKR